jgi:hypothetical protein
MSRITIVFDPDERAALDELAHREYRDVRQQALLIIRRELERRGLLADDNGAAESQPEKVQHAAD